jgi:hypothetical protein
MAETLKVLGQVSPSATTNTVLYTVPSSRQTVISTIAVCNRAAVAATFRIIVQAAADIASVATKQYIAYDTTVAKNDTTFITVGLTLAAGDRVQVYSSTTTLSFSAYGSEATL